MLDQLVPLYSSVPTWSVGLAPGFLPPQATAAVWVPKFPGVLLPVFKLLPSLHDDPSHSSDAAEDPPGVNPPKANPAV